MSIRKDEAVDLLYEGIQRLNELHSKLNRVASIFNPSPDNIEGQKSIAAVKDAFEAILKHIQDKPAIETDDVNTSLYTR